MSNFKTHALWCVRKLAHNRLERGATLAELLVVLVIVSTLAVVALPMAETSVQRRHESELRSSLRTVRTAIDRFNADWSEGRMEEDADGVSENGFPKSLAVMVEGVAASEDGDPPLRYLRRVPSNPFTAGDRPLSEHWRLMGYLQKPDDMRWDGKDIYDLRPVTDRKALDGSDIEDW